MRILTGYLFAPENLQTHKRAENKLQRLCLKIQHLEANNKFLKTQMHSLMEKHSKELESQAEMFRHLLQEQKIK